VKQIKLTTMAVLLMIQALATYALSPDEGQSCLESPTPETPAPETAAQEMAAQEAASPETAAPEPAAPETAVAVTDSVSKSNVVDDEAAINLVAESYSKTCAICHAAGLADAPRFGFSEDWAARIAKGKEVLYQSSINGLPPAMPAKGMCFSCSDDDLKALVDYMVENSQ
jgi:cytochrome c5